MKFSRREVLPVLASVGASIGRPRRARAAEGRVRIGVLSDQSGPYADLAGPGSVEATRLAIEDFGSTVLGRPIEVLVGDHQNKPDIGAALARRWYETENVRLIVDVVASSVALAVQTAARQSDQIMISTASGSTVLLETGCSPNGFVWTWDSYALATSMGKAVTQEGGKSWFLIEVNYALGTALEKDLRPAVEAAGGKIVGVVKHPLNSSDFSSYLVAAQASGANVIGLLNGGSDAITTIKQAAEFGIMKSPQRVVATASTIADIHALGLQAAQGLRIVESFYWDQNDKTRAFSKRFFAKTNRMPTMIQAGAYSAVNHYLKAAKSAGSLTTSDVLAAMRKMPVNDFMTNDALIRSDGRLLRDFYLLEAKTPAESKGPWDYLKLVKTIPAMEAVAPPAVGVCPIATP